MPSSGDGFLGGFLVPHDQQNVAIGQPCDVVMGLLLVIEELEIPDEVSFPGKLLNTASRTAARWLCPLVEAARPQEVSILKKISAHGGATVRFPCLHGLSFHVNEVGLGGVDG